MGRPKLELAGKRFGRLVVVEEAGRKNRAVLWLCKCDCGNESIVESHELVRGGIRSCGCLGRETASERSKARSTTHGLSRSRLYHIWRNMISRCECSSSENYERYGGRGITVCSEWRDFVAFRDWAIPAGYSDDLTLDREDVNGNYEPSNCKWATRTEQQNNRRDSTKLSLNGETHTIPEWERITGISRATIRSRLKLGWSAEEALTRDIQKHQRRIYDSAKFNSLAPDTTP